MEPARHDILCGVSAHPKERTVRSCCPLVYLAAILLVTLPALSQVVVTQVNDEGVPAPCIGIGIGLLLEKKCVDAVGKQGFVRHNELGDPGFTLGKGAQDGIVTEIEPDSPASAAGLKPGETLVSVDGKTVTPTPGQAAAQQIFGERNKTVVLQLRHEGVVHEVTLTRAPLAPPDPPKAPSFIMSSRPLINWRGKYVPCNSGPGPTGLPVLAFCEKHYQSYGYIRASELGTTGLVLNLDDPSRAVITSVEPNSPAAGAGIVHGDEIVQVDGKPLAASTTRKATIALFAKPGDRRTITVSDAGTQKTVDLVLARPK